MAPSKDSSANGIASAPAARNVPAGTARRAIDKASLFGSIPVTMAPRADNEPPRTPVPQPMSRIRFPASGANVATITDMASFSGGNSPSRVVPVALDLSPRRLCRV